MLSCQQTQNVIDGKKRIILNPSEAQKRDFEAATFAEGEVWGIDILVSSGEDGKVGQLHSHSSALLSLFFDILTSCLFSRLVWRTPGHPFISGIPLSPIN